MKRKILYFEIYENIEKYKKINLYKSIKDKKISLYNIIKKNQIDKDIKHNIRILKFKILALFNLTKKVETEEKITYIIYSDKYSEKRVIKKVENLINKNKEKTIVLSKQIKQMWENINKEKDINKAKQKFLYKKYNNESKIEKVIKYYQESKHLYNNYIQQILNNIIKTREEIPEEQGIYILIKSDKIQNMNNIIKMIPNYKIINIVTPNINNFKRLEYNLENSAETITILNNKRKSLSRAKYIINIDFTMQEIESYNLNRTAIIFNICDTELKNLKNFDGIIIQNIKIKEEEQEKYSLQDKYTANILNKQDIGFELNNQIENAIENQQFNVIGNNGAIDFKQLKNK